MSYKIKILSDKEFEKLPYPEMDMSLGVADPVKKTAYVRYTSSPELNRYLVDHELEHLIDGAGGVHSDHYRNGVYYKGFGEIFTNAGAMIPGPWMIPAQLGSAAMASRRSNQSQSQGNVEYPGGWAGVTSESGATGTPNTISAAGGNGMGSSGGTTQGSAVDKIRQSGFFGGRSPEGFLQ